MIFEEALREMIINAQNVTAQVYFLAADSKAAAPYMVIKASEGNRIQTLAGYLNTKRVSVETHIICKKYSDLKLRQSNFINMLIAASNNKSIGPCAIQGLTYEAPVEGYDPEMDLYTSSMNINFTI